MLSHWREVALVIDDGLPTLVFELDEPVPHPWAGADHDATYHVTLSGITERGVPVGDQSYATTLIQTPTPWLEAHHHACWCRPRDPRRRRVRRRSSPCGSSR